MIPITSKKDKAQLKDHALNLLKKNSFEGLVILVEDLKETDFDSELKDANFKIDVKNYYLEQAARLGYLETVKYLIDSGANIHIRNNETLRWAVYQGHREIVKYLLEQGAYVHASDDYALRWAAENGYLDVVKCAVEHGANVLADNSYALRMANINGHIEVEEYLKEVLKNDRNHN